MQLLRPPRRMHMPKTAGYAIAPLSEQIKSYREFQPLAWAYSIHFTHSLLSRAFLEIASRPFLAMRDKHLLPTYRCPYAMNMWYRVR